MVNILVGITGSVATIKLPELLRQLYDGIPGCAIKVVATERAMHFITDPSNSQVTIPPVAELLWDKDEWQMWKKRGDPVLHIDLRNWADIMVIAPLDANTLAKIANGLCDNLLTCVIRAWELGRKPIVLCPAMNTQMWQHPLTDRHLAVCRRDFGFHIVPPVEKVLICGESGMGAMALVENIMATVKRVLCK